MSTFSHIRTMEPLAAAQLLSDKLRNAMTAVKAVVYERQDGSEEMELAKSSVDETEKLITELIEEFHN